VNQRYLVLHLLSGLIFLMCAVPIQQVYGADEQPDLKRLYEVSASERFQNPVIVIHGVFGAKIRTIKDQKEIWPGNTSSLLFSSYEKLALDIDPATLETRTGHTEAYALFDRVGGHDYYGKIVKTLHEAGRYESAITGRSQAPNTHAYYVFVYDWRRDIARNAAKLDAFIDQIRRDYNMPKLKVDIVAHSMGALLTRYLALQRFHTVINPVMEPADSKALASGGADIWNIFSMKYRRSLMPLARFLIMPMATFPASTRALEMGCLA